MSCLLQVTSIPTVSGMMPIIPLGALKLCQVINYFLQRILVTLTGSMSSDELHDSNGIQHLVSVLMI